MTDKKDRVNADLEAFERQQEQNELRHTAEVEALKQDAIELVRQGSFCDWNSSEILEWLLEDDKALLNIIRQIIQRDSTAHFNHKLEQMVIQAAMKSLADIREIELDEGDLI